MENNFLITGASGYLGGTVLNRLKHINLPDHKLYAVVRNQTQAQAVKRYGAEPLQFDVFNEENVVEVVLRYKINIVFSLHDAFGSMSHKHFITALAKLREGLAQEVHFLHTSGAKMFSDHTGAPDKKTYDDDPEIYSIQKAQKSPFPSLQQALDSNNTIIEQSEKLGVRCYIFMPCMVYGKGEGFGNVVSIQTTAIVKAAKAVGRVYKMSEIETSWPVCHVIDTARLYLELLSKIMRNESPDHGKEGYYLASSGKVAWNDVYSSIAVAMQKRGLTEGPPLQMYKDTALDKMASALGSPRDMVAPQLSGNCLLTARHGYKLGWKPQFAVEHIFSSLDTEVELILQYF